MASVPLLALLGPCARCGGSRWVRWGSYPQRLREYARAGLLRIARICCAACRTTRSLPPQEVVPRHHYARSVIVSALSGRRQGWSWERCAVACTSDGLVATRVVRRWAIEFELISQHGMPFTPQPTPLMLSTPVGRRRLDPRQEDPWRSPPEHP